MTATGPHRSPDADRAGDTAPPADQRPDPASETRSDDDRDTGWGDDLDRGGPGGGRDLRWYEEQRPPHWE